MSHLTYAVYFALLVSGGEALLGNRTWRERANRAAYVFTCTMVAVVAGGWIMFLIHR